MRTSPKPIDGPDIHAQRFVTAACELVGAVRPDAGNRVRLVLSAQTPANWALWSTGPSSFGEGPRLIARRPPHEPASLAERGLFHAGRLLVGSIVGKLALTERCWLLKRLDSARDEEPGTFTPHLELALDLVGAGFGLVLTLRLSASASATVCSMGGRLTPRREPAAA